MKCLLADAAVHYIIAIITLCRSCCQFLHRSKPRIKNL